MKYLIMALIGLAISSTSQAATPTRESLQELFTESGYTNETGVYESQLYGIVYGRLITRETKQPVSKDKAQAIEDMAHQIASEQAAKVKEEFLAKKIQIFQAALTQEEVDRLISLYKSPTGKVLRDTYNEAFGKFMLFNTEQVTKKLQDIEKMVKETPMKTGEKS